jgi:hypothetical protein
MFHNISWKEKGGAFPFYDLDLAYNVLKRARRELLEENPETISKAECYKYVKDAYEKLIAVLERQDNKYAQLNKEQESSEIRLKYAEQLRTYPFIDTFLNAKERLGSDFETIFGENISKMLFTAAVSPTDQPENEVKDEVKNE